jgi:hypothetical protein
MLLAAVVIGSAGAGEQPARLGEAVTPATPAKGQPQYFPRAAWSLAAKAWLVVWQDGDPTVDGTTGKYQAQDVLAARVSAEGKVLDAKPIEVASVKGAQQRPTVASDGKDWLVVWHDLRSGKDWDLYAARISADGKVAVKGGALLVGGSHNQCFADVVFGSGNYYVAWLDMRHWPEYRVFGSRVSREGKALDGRGVELIRTMSDKAMENWKKAPFAPGKKGVGWHAFGRKKGSVRQPCPPSLGANGKVYVVTSCVTGAGPSRAYAARTINAAGGKPSGAQIGFSLPSKLVMSAPNYWVRQRHVAVGERGFLTANSQYCAGFGASGQAYWLTTFLDPKGAPVGGKSAKVERVFLDATQRIPPGYRTYGLRNSIIDLAWDGKRGLFVAEHHGHSSRSKKGPGTPGNIDIWAIFVNAEGKRLSDPAGTQAVEADAVKGKGPRVLLPEGCKVAPIKVAAGPATQSAPCAAAGPEGSFLVAWMEEEPGRDSRIIARLVRVK